MDAYMHAETYTEVPTEKMDGEYRFWVFKSFRCFQCHDLDKRVQKTKLLRIRVRIYQLFS